MSRSETRQVAAPRSSKISLGCEHLTTLDFFRLQPIYCAEQLPGGDSFNVSIKSFIESAPFATKVFGSCHLDLHAFFVPYGLIWNSWNQYYSGNSQNLSIPNQAPPSITLSLANQIFDFGIKTGSTRVEPQFDEPFVSRRSVFGSLGYPVYSGYTNDQSNYRWNLLPALAYQRIWWDFYRDSQNIVDADKAAYLVDHSGAFNLAEARKAFTVRYRCFKKDYISTLLKNPQMGGSSASAAVTSSTSGTLGSGVPEYILPDGTEKPNSAASGMTISREVSAQVLRGAIATQRYLERLGVSGTRPLERLMSEFGKYPEREKLNMTQFIGSSSIPVNIDGLTNTSSQLNVSMETSDNAFGISDQSASMGQKIGMANGFQACPTWSHTSNEYGVYMVIASIIPDFKYNSTVDRMFYNGVGTAESSALDYFHPDFQDLGYQECLLSEVAVPTFHDIDQNSTWESYDPFQVVGYQPKYENYRHSYNRVSGQMSEYSLRESLPQMAMIRHIPSLYDPDEVVAGLNLTTSSEADRTDFDNHFSVTNDKYDHFVCKFDITNNATRPITGSDMPTELTHIINSGVLDVSNGGVKL